MRRTLGIWIMMGALLVALPATVVALDSASDPRAALIERVASGALRVGDRGQQVATLQQLLKDAGFDPVKIDGIYGPLTEAAVRQAQQALGLPVDGRAGRMTVAALTGSQSKPVQAAPAVPAAPQAADQGAGRTLVVYRAGEGTAPATDAPGSGQGTGSADRAHLFSLTFDGAPDPTLLPEILSELKRYGMKATFFLHGEASEQAPDLIAQIAAAGHEIGTSGFTTGIDLTRLTDPSLQAQLSHAQDSIRAAAGEAPAFFRPAAGRFDQRVVRAAQKLHMQTVLWTNVAFDDAPGLDPQELATQIAGMVYPGAVVMLHQDRPGTVKALDTLLQNLRQQGFQSVALSKLVNS